MFTIATTGHETVIYPTSQERSATRVVRSVRMFGNRAEAGGPAWEIDADELTVVGQADAYGVLV